jgi:UDPglucose--hexose-1-phosphate uridylyltransferase
VIAPHRARRPGAGWPHIEAATPEELDSCPFCAGHEDRTPPETLRIGEPWRVRVVPNLYPAFQRQEVVVHTPEHVRTVAELDDDQLALVADAWQRRERATPGYLHALINEGRVAGSSLAHSHSQLVWLDAEPPVPKAERGETCRLCDSLELERAEGTRVVAERDGLVLLCPYASRSAYECLIAPVEHEERAFASPLLGAALDFAAEGLRRLAAAEGPRPMNLWLHEAGHWHLELLPRLSVIASLELGAGHYINTLAPEKAAERLRG